MKPSKDPKKTIRLMKKMRRKMEKQITILLRGHK